MTNKTARTRTLVCAFVIGAVTLTAGGGVALRAQGPPGAINPFTAVLAKLDQILAILTAPPPGPGPVVLSTPFVTKGETDLAGCNVANVGTTTISVGSRWVDFQGTTILTNQAQSLAPGHAVVGYAGGGGVLNIRCEFSFVGTAAAVRANLAVENQAGQTLVSVDAR
jgi:hypothetical protein